MSDWKYGNTLGFGNKPALLISDMQNAYTRGHYDPDLNQDAEISLINALIKKFREKQLPIIYTVIQFDDQDIAHPNIWLQKIPKLADLHEDSPIVAIDETIDYNKDTDEVIVKKNPSSFYQTSLAEQLHTQEIDTLVITGCTTSGCVRATAVDSMQYGLRTIVVEDAVADRWPDAHRQALYEINAKYGDVLDAQRCLHQFDA